MDTNIYHQENRTRLKAAIQAATAPPEFTYRDDPDFVAFCAAIRHEVEHQNIERERRNGTEPDSVRMNKLYGVWFTSATFRAHWVKPTKRSENDILWILYNRGWSFLQGGCAVIAWWRIHHRTVTAEMLDELFTLANRVWNEVEDKKMKKTIEAQQNSLRSRIIWFLQQQPATTAFLAAKLNATSKAVDSHLYRLRKEGIVVRQSWGLYAIAKTAHPNIAESTAAAAHDAKPKTQTVSAVVHDASAPANSWDLSDIEDGVDEPTCLPSISSREGDDLWGADGSRIAEPCYMTTAEPRELPTAEPRW